jgi:hypothetical protein
MSETSELIIYFFLLPRCSHTWELAPALEHRAEFLQFLNQEQSVGLLGRVISSSQGLYRYTNTEKHTHTQTLNIHALSEIRTHGPGFRASEGSVRLRPLGYRDRLNSLYYCYLKFLTLQTDRLCGLVVRVPG